jgi:hypothetical protein
VAAHKKAKEWLAKQEKKIEPKKRPTALNTADPSPADPEKNPKADPPVKGAKVWPHFAKVFADDKSSREPHCP